MKLLFTAAAALLFSTSAFSQKLHLGIKAGANFNNVENISTFYDNSSVGYHAGAFAEIGFGKINLQPEVYFSNVKLEESTGFFPDINLRYLNIPVLFNFKLLPVLSLQAGPQFGIMLNKDKSTTQNGEDAFKTGDLGIAAGLQANLTKLKIFARYVGGLTDIRNNNTGESVKNRQVHVGLGFRLF